MIVAVTVSISNGIAVYCNYVNGVTVVLISDDVAGLQIVKCG